MLRTGARLLATAALVLPLTGCDTLEPEPDGGGGMIRLPPYHGTIFIAPDLITADDPTTFVSLTPAGTGARTMYDRRVGDWITVEARLFAAEYSDGFEVEVQVNPEFDGAEAEEQAGKYAEVIGRIPTALRLDVETVWIHKGTEPFGGGNNNLLVHVGQGALYEADGILEETFLHEAAHTSLDAYHADAPGWLAAQAADSTFISAYARDYPQREDVAETIVPYIAVRYRPERITEGMADTVLRAIPNRVEYLDGAQLEMHPIPRP